MDKEKREQFEKYKKMELALIQEGFTVFSQEAAKKRISEEGESAKHTPQIFSPRVISNVAEKKPGREPIVVQQQVARVEEEEYDIPTIVSYLKWHMERISKNVIGREEIIRQAMFAILTREHLLLLSRTGMAKSFLANYIFNTFDNVRIFSAQATKDQTPDNYFGPYNIEEFKKGRIRHNIHRSIIEADLVFLDEFFDASDVVLRSLLTVLNERKFINGPEIIDAAVHTAIATANYMRMNEVTEAVLDRFLYKAIIPEMNNVYTQILIDHTYSFSRGVAIEPEKKIPFGQIIYLSSIVRNENKKIKIEIPDIVYFMKNVVVNKFVSEMRKSEYNFFISPRKQAKISDFLRASALLDNRFEANMEDVKNMYLTLCTLNSYISVKARDKSEKDVFLDTYQQTMVHFNNTGALQQIEFLLGLRKVFQEIREDPSKKEKLKAARGLLSSLFGLFRKIFPSKNKVQDEEVTLEMLKQSINEINPAVEEVRELKEGILRDYRDLLV
ncbi:MAG: MoxR family ATPase [Spirochaetes bacterium]|nr:MoxR family ATPase [Spirochaetota bacterium]